ncbi:MAG: hypothetical protein HZA52_03060 [Planctomycetes bacterium]|nr:hypothetical protein [Planctomycetota bacterium]
MHEVKSTSLTEDRRARARVAGWLVLLALGVSFGIFALPGKPRIGDRPQARPDRTRSVPTDRAVLTREIWVRVGSLGGSKPRSTAAVVAELAEFGSPLAHAALAVLLGEAKPPTKERGAVPLEIGPHELAELLYSVIDRLPPEGVMAAVEDALAAGRVRGQELVGLRALGSSRHPRALELWIELAEAVPPASAANERYQAAAARSFERLIDAVPGNRANVRLRAERIQGPALTFVARAMAKSDDPGSLGTVLALLGRSPLHDGGLLRALGSIARQCQLGLDPIGAAKLRRYARESEPIARADALAALGGFADPESIELLIAALADPDELVRTAARVGLERISRLELGAERASWNAWWEREWHWAETRLGLLLPMVDSADPDAVIAALSELAEHPYLRHQLARTAGELVDDPREAVALAACRVAGTLRSQAAAPALLSALSSKVDARRDAAWEALRAITGRSLPRQEQAWREVLALD